MRRLVGFFASLLLAPCGFAAGTTRYTYDAFGNLLKVVLPDGNVIEYIIDGQNRRVGRKLNGSVTHRWFYADQLRIIAELDENGAVTKRFVYSTRSNVPDYMTAGGVTYRIYSDNLGSPRTVVNLATGIVKESRRYDEFGSILADTNPGFIPFGFAGGLYDPTTGLVRFGARDYDPRSGRWTAKDPIGFGGGDANVYTYTWSDPLNFNDDTGLDGKAASAWALSEVGNDDYQHWDPSDEVQGRLTSLFGGRFSNKCNIFVWDALTAGGNPPPRMADGRIPSAGEWADPRIAIPGYFVVPAGGLRRRGDVVAASNGHGGFHVGIYYPLPGNQAGTVSASAKDQTVVHNTWGFRRGEPASTIRRCECER